MPRIYMKVKVQDTVIKKVLSTYVPLPLPMMEYEVVGATLKADVQKEDDASPYVDLWDSWFYKSWKEDRSTMHPLAENWQHLLGIFWKFSLRWWKCCHLKLWIVFGKIYQSSSHITHKKLIKGRCINHINQDRGVDTHKVYQCYGNGRYSYIGWCIQRRGLIPILKDFYLPMIECMKRIADCSWWEWDTGSSLFFWKWPQQYQAWDKEVRPYYAMDNSFQFFALRIQSKRRRIETR